MIRIRRTFIAALAATAVVASMGATSSVAEPTASTSACIYKKFWKISKRQHVTCTKAKKVLKNDPKVSGGKGLPGWKCTTGSGVIPEGKCSKRGTNKSFKYAQK